MNLHIAKALNDLKDYEQADAILGEAAHSWPFDLLVKINQVGMLQNTVAFLSIQNMKTWCERVIMFCGFQCSGKELGRLGEAYHAPLQGNARRSKGWLFGKDPRCQRCFAEFQMALPNGKPVNIRHHWTLPKLLLKLHTTLGTWSSLCFCYTLWTKNAVAISIVEDLPTLPVLDFANMWLDVTKLCKILISAVQSGGK